MTKDVWGRDDSAHPPEWALLEKVLLASLVEQRRARRWSIFFKLLAVSLLIMLVVLFTPQEMHTSGTWHTGVVKVNGEISADTDASADNIILGLDAAFEAPRCKAVILSINSPGGSPVQADMIYREIWRLRKLHPDRKVYAVISDMGASGAYYIASAANEIYVSPASMVGSIGVIMGGFGFPDLLNKLGVERRVLTAGQHKAIGDPFSPVKPDEKTYLLSMLEAVHQQFIAAVRQGRGARLHETPDIFSGLFWTGDQAVTLGLADGFGSAHEVARNIIHAPELVDYSHEGNPLDHAFKKLGVSATQGLFQGWQASWHFTSPGLN